MSLIRIAHYIDPMIVHELVVAGCLTAVLCSIILSLGRGCRCRCKRKR